MARCPVILATLLASSLLAAGAAPAAAPEQLARIDHVADGDTVDLTNGDRVRLVQIDTPEVYCTPDATAEGPRRSRSGCYRPARSSV